MRYAEARRGAPFACSSSGLGSTVIKKSTASKGFSHVLPGRHQDLPPAEVRGLPWPCAPFGVLVLLPVHRDRRPRRRHPRRDLRPPQRRYGGTGPIQGLLHLALLLPTLAVGARRLHDTGRSGWWLLIGLIPVVGWIILIVFFVQDSQPANKYGPTPRASARATAQAMARRPRPHPRRSNSESRSVKARLSERSGTLADDPLGVGTDQYRAPLLPRTHPGDGLRHLRVRRMATVSRGAG